MTDFDNRFLDHFTYDAREDDGYGPDHPRLGDKGWLARLSGLGAVLHVKDFEVAYDRFGLPSIRTSQTISGRECTGMLGMQDVFADERLHVTLTERKPGDAFRERGRQYRYALEGVGYRLDPPFEEHVTRVYALAGSNTKNPVLGLFDFSTDMPVTGPGTSVKELLKHIGYQIEQEDARPGERRTRQHHQMSGVHVERRCGMVTGATCRNVGLSWLPAGGRHGTRTWVLSTQNGDTTRRIRLSHDEIGALTDILWMLADGERAADAQAG